MIRLLEHDSNARGALFARLMQDLFRALGYHEFRMGTPKAGRELDLWAEHRVEARSALAECKATKEPVGGDAINKFAGALEIERNEHPGRTITGYFVSLSGFRASARAQEESLAVPRLVLLSSAEIEQELVHQRLIVSRDAAAACASAYVRERGGDDAVAGATELLAWDEGWTWCCQLERAGDAIGYVLVHADGQPLGPRAAAALKGKDALAGGVLTELVDLGPQERSAAPAVGAIKAAYLAHLVREHGDVTVDGLPAVDRLGSRRLRLEQLDVPLQLEDLGTAELGDGALLGDDDQPVELADAGMPVGAVLAGARSIAVLGAPGAGKSTLLKRLAVAYADPARRLEIADGLPEQSWLPLVIRCRELASTRGTTIRALLESLPLQAEIEDPQRHFASVVSAALADGQALVLIDGLDEIVDDAARVRFAKQLRTFIGSHPDIGVVVTAREAGFRAVAGALGDVCATYRVADLNRDGILQLTLVWQRLLDGRSSGAEQEARELAEAIDRSLPLRRLATNPLLLTTLLLVHYWIGELPSKRTVLYAKAIDVLLSSWNVEGHAPVDADEAIPQLAYVAYAMTKSGRQALSAQELILLLREARAELPEVLRDARMSPATFVAAVEERSGLLTLGGHAVVDGVLTALYEFKHRTFQEHLTAVACVEGFRAGAGDGSSVAALLEPHLDDGDWREVISLAIALSVRDAAPLVTTLCTIVEDDVERFASAQRVSWPAALLLGRALADEAPIPPALVDRSCRALASALGVLLRPDRVVRDLLAGCYGERFEQLCADAFQSAETAEALAVGEGYAEVLAARELSPHGELAADALRRVAEQLSARGDPQAQVRGALMLMHLAYFNLGNEDDELADLAVLAETPLRSASVPAHYAATWAYAHLARGPSMTVEQASRVAPRLLELWRTSALGEVRQMAAWAFSELPLWEHDVDLGVPGDELDSFVRGQQELEIPDAGWFTADILESAVALASQIAQRSRSPRSRQ